MWLRPVLIHGCFVSLSLTLHAWATPVHAQSSTSTARAAAAKPNTNGAGTTRALPAQLKALARELAQTYSTRLGTAGDAQRLGQALSAGRTHLERVERQLAAGNDARAERGALSESAAEIEVSVRSIVRRAQAAAARLRAAGQSLAAAQVDAFSARLQADLTAYQNAVTPVAKGPMSRRTRLDAARRALEHGQQPARTPDRSPMPFHLEAARRQPAPAPATGTAVPAPAPPDPADLQQTAEVQFTPEIVALAATLGNTPLVLYEYVRNSLRFEPYFGSLKGAEATRQTSAGNDYDAASLLIALLRVSGIPARYARGTVTVSATRLASLLGLTDVAQVGPVLTLAGFPVSPITDGHGTVTAYDVDHVWVRAFVPVGNYRGVPNDSTEGVWVALDPSLKDQALQSGIADIPASVPFNATGCQTATPGYLCSVRPEVAYQFYRQQVQGFLTTAMPGTSTADVGVNGPILPEEFGILPLSPPFQMTGPAVEFAAIAESTQYWVALGINGAQFAAFALPAPAEPNGAPPVLARKTVRWTSASAADRAIVDAFGGPAETPPAAINLVPEFLIDGTVEAQGPAVAPGMPVAVNVGILFPDPDPNDGNPPRWDVVTHWMPAGQYVALALDGNHTSPEYLNARAQQLLAANTARCAPCTGACTDSCAAAVDPDALLGELLHLAGNFYLTRLRDGEAALLDLFHHTIVRYVYEGLTESALDVQYLFDRPYAVTTGSLLMDWQHEDASLASIDGDTSQTRALADLIFLNRSAQEHASWEELVGIASMSTVKDLQLAFAGGVQVFQNVASDAPVQCGDGISRPVFGCGGTLGCLGACGVPSASIALMCNDLSAGRVITTPECPVCPTCQLRLNRYSGTGWVSTDPVSGSATYIIQGHLAAGSALHTGAATTLSPAALDTLTPLDSQHGARLLAGVPVVTIDAATVHTLLPQLGLPTVLQEHISALVAHGAVVTLSPVVLDLDGHEVLVLRTDGPAPHSTQYLVFDPLAGGQVTGQPGPVERPGNTGNCGATFSGDPVNIANGNFFRHEVDFAIPALGIPLSFERSYNSFLTADGPLGIGWTHNYTEHLVSADDGTIEWIAANGGSYRFEPDGLGGFITPVNLTLPHVVLQTIPGGFTITEKEGFVRQFDSTGRLTMRRDRYGNAQTLTYDGSGRLATVADAAGRLLSFTSDGAGHILTASDFTGRTWTYAYNGVQLTTVTSPSDAHTPAMVTRYAYYTGALNGNLLQSITEPNDGVVQLSYYADGRIFQTVDPEGGTVTYRYDLLNNATYVIDARGLTSTYHYDSAGNLTQLDYPDGSAEYWTWETGLQSSHTDARGFTEMFAYDSLGNVTHQVDPSGAVTALQSEPLFSNITLLHPRGSRQATYEYDSSGNLVATHDALGNTTRYTYDAHGSLLTVTDARGLVTTMAYNSAGQATTLTSQLPSTTTNTYTARGMLSTHADANGTTGTYNYDLLDRLTSITTADGQVTRLEYDAGGRNTAMIAPNGAVWQFHYDRNNLLVQRVNPDGTTQSVTYDPDGHLVSITDELGYQTRMTYDTRGRVVHIESDGGTLLQATYDAAGNRTSVTDALGTTTRFEYDVLGRVTRGIRVDGSTTQLAYDENDNLTSITDSRGGVTSFQYDALNRVTQIRRPEGGVETYDYDADGNLINFTYYDVSGLATIPDDPRTLPPGRKRPWTQVFDALNRLTSLTTPTGAALSYTYDPAGQLTAFTDALGHTHHYEYNVHGNLTKVTHPDNGVVLLEYDQVGNPTHLTTPNGGEYHWNYNSMGLITSATDPLGAVTSTTYDAKRRRIRQDNPDGTATIATYDALDRPLLTQHSDGSFVARTYDANGNLTATSTDQTALQLTYDQRNRRTSEALTFKDTGQSESVQYAYDSEDNLVQVADPSGRTIQYTYDLAGRTTRVSSGAGGPAVDLAYNGYGERATLTYGNGIAGSYTYDGEGRILGMNYGTVGQLAYTRNLGGAPSGITESIAGIPESLTLTYDSLGQPLTVGAAYDASRRETFAYDLDGNLLNPGNGSATTFNVADQPTLNRAMAYTHDGRGNQQSRTSGVQTLATPHTLDNRLAELRTLVGGTVQRDLQLVYDGLGRIVETRNGAAVTRIVYGQVDRLLEYDGSGTVQVAYLPHPGHDDVLAAVVGGQTRYVHPDALGSPRAFSDASGTIVGARRYGQFGRLLGSSGSPEVTLGFSGRPFDALTGLVDMRARWYDPALGRFLGRDALPITAQQPNPYTYATNRPGQFIDPFGLTPQPPLREKILTAVWQNVQLGWGGLKSIPPSAWNVGKATVGFFYGGLTVWTQDIGFNWGAYVEGNMLSDDVDREAHKYLLANNSAYAAMDNLPRVIPKLAEGLNAAGTAALTDLRGGQGNWRAVAPGYYDRVTALMACGAYTEAGQTAAQPVVEAYMTFEMGRFNISKRPNVVPGQVGALGEVNSFALSHGKNMWFHAGQFHFPENYFFPKHAITTPEYIEGFHYVTYPGGPERWNGWHFVPSRVGSPLPNDALFRFNWKPRPGELPPVPEWRTSMYPLSVPNIIAPKNTDISWSDPRP